MLRKSWFELIVEYKLVNKLYNYILSEYREFLKSGVSDVGKFIASHKYISQDIVRCFKRSKLKADCGLNIKGSSHELFRINFVKVMNVIGEVPTFSEFSRVSEISPHTYYKNYTNSWDDIVKIFVDDEVKIEEFNRRKETNLIANAKLGSKVRIEKHGIPLIELEQEFRRVFDSTKLNYGTYPTKRYFNKVSIYNDFTYRKRFKIRWSEICEMYGYKIEKRNKSEDIVLETIKGITNVEYIPQMTWSWLLGSKGGRMYCDGYFEKLNLVVEFDGVQHRKPVSNMGGQEAYEQRVINDQLKDELLKLHRINIIRIDSRENWHDPEYIKNKLSDLLDT